MNHLIGFVAVVWLICGLAMGAPLCATMIHELSPCLPYLMESTASPSEDCCNGVKDIAEFSKSEKDRCNICECIKSVIAMLVGIDTSRILPLPGKCGLNTSLPSVSQDTDCSKCLSLTYKRSDDRIDTTQHENSLSHKHFYIEQSIFCAGSR